MTTLAYLWIYFRLFGQLGEYSHAPTRTVRTKVPGRRPRSAPDGGGEDLGQDQRDLTEEDPPDDRRNADVVGDHPGRRARPGHGRLPADPPPARGVPARGGAVVVVLHRAAARLRRLGLVAVRPGARHRVPRRLPGREVAVGRQPVRVHAAAGRVRGAGGAAAAGAALRDR